MIKIKLNYILSAIVAALLVLCVASVYTPMSFDNQKTKREKAVKERLVTIRKAEEAYKPKYGIYTADFNKLVGSKLIDDSIQYVPFSQKAKFELTTTVHTGKSGATTSLMECGTTYNIYLNGVDEKKIAEITEEANTRGEYPGLKFGDITTPNDNAGNWE